MLLNWGFKKLDQLWNGIVVNDQDMIKQENGDRSFGSREHPGHEAVNIDESTIKKEANLDWRQPKQLDMDDGILFKPINVYFGSYQCKIKLVKLLVNGFKFMNVPKNCKNNEKIRFHITVPWHDIKKIMFSLKHRETYLILQVNENGVEKIKSALDIKDNTQLIRYTGEEHDISARYIIIIIDPISSTVKRQLFDLSLTNTFSIEEISYDNADDIIIQASNPKEYQPFTPISVKNDLEKTSNKNECQNMLISTPKIEGKPILIPEIKVLSPLKPRRNPRKQSSKPIINSPFIPPDFIHSDKQSLKRKVETKSPALPIVLSSPSKRIKRGSLRLNANINQSSETSSQNHSSCPTVPLSQYVINRDLEKLLSTELYTDLVLRFPDGNEMKTHRAILAARSTVFMDLLKSRVINDGKSVIDIFNYEYSIMKDLINYIYTDKLTDEPSDLEKLFLAAQTYNLKGLSFLCEQKLSVQITPNNAVNLLFLADENKAFYLKEHVLEYIGLNALDVTGSKDWKDRLMVHRSLYYEAFSRVMK